MKKKLLFVTNGLYGGGTEVILQTLLSHISRDLFEITVLSVNQQAVGPEYPNECDYCYIFGSYSEGDPSYKQFLIKVINKIKLLIYYHLTPKWSYRLFIPKGFDVEVAFIEGYATRIISASTNKRSRKIAWVHIDLMNNHWTDIAYRSRSEESAAYAKFDDVVCVSENVRNSMRSINPSLQNLRVIYNPVDDIVIRNKAQETVTYSKYEEGPIKMVSVGRLVPQKGYDRLLPILKRLHDEGYSFVMNILGEGPDRSELERYISENEMQSYVSLMGFISNPYPYIKDSDLFVCSSRSEGYSTAVTEALILGVPVITTLCSGMEELLGNGEFGIIVDNDDDSLYVGISKVLSKEIDLGNYRKKSEMRGKDFSLKRQMSSIEGLFQEGNAFRVCP